jgi:HSP20 family protein
MAESIVRSWGVMSHSDLLPPLEHEDLGDEVARLFQDLDRARPLDQRLLPGAFSPTLETADAIEIVLDVPGVPPDDLRVLIKASVVVIAGGKRPPNQSERALASFHLVERDFGRFARAVRLTGAFDGTAATSVLTGGELRVRIPRLVERRGCGILVPVRRPASS